MNAILSALLIAALAAPSPTPSAGDIAFQGGDFDAAFVAYNDALTAAPNDANANLGLGTIDLYRDDLTNARTYLTRAATLAPGDALARTRLQTIERRERARAEFMVETQAPEVVIPFVAVDPLPLLHAKINGHPLTLALDTGASSLDLSPNAAAELGVASAQRLHLQTFSVNGLVVHNVAARLIPGGIESSGRRVDGAIGTAFLAHFLATIDYLHGQLVLQPRAAGTAFESEAALNKASIVPMWLINGHSIFVRARIDDAPSALFKVETGRSTSGVTLFKAAETPQFVARTIAVGTIANVNVPGVYAVRDDRNGAFPFAVAGAISHGFFRNTRLTFDFDAMKMIVESS